MTSSVTLIGGGVRSGKSAFALRRALELGQQRRLIATAEAGDPEMRARIAAHRRERGDRFDTLEEPQRLAHALQSSAGYDVVVVDCLTLWLANRLLDEDLAAGVLDEVDALVGVLRSLPFHTILVTNEVGMGIVPDSRLGREFRDLAGIANRRVAAIADDLYFAALGTVLRLRPPPLQVIAPAPCR